MSDPTLVVCAGCCADIGGTEVLELATRMARSSDVVVATVECLDVCADQPAIGVGERRALVLDTEAIRGVIATLDSGEVPQFDSAGLVEVRPT